MNSNLDRSPLTTDQLVEIAVRFGVMTAEGAQDLHAAVDKRFHSTMLDRTRNARYEMWADHELRLDSRPYVAPIAYQVRVITTGMGEAGTPQFEHLVDVLAETADEALLVATQLAASRADLVVGADRLMPLSAAVVTDSTLDAF